MSNKLFATDVPGDGWIDFSAEGFVQPVTGVIYRNGSNNRGVPLGGLGTGFITLCSDGTLDYYSTIFNAFMERAYYGFRDSKRRTPIAAVHDRSGIPSHKLPFLGMSIGDQTWILSTAQNKGVKSPQHLDYWGHYPIADLEYKLDSPIQVGLRAWTPFNPGDAPSSNAPGAVFDVHLRNDSKDPVNGRLAFSFHGPRLEEMVFNAHGPLQDAVRPAKYHRSETDGPISGVNVSTSWEDDMDYAYVLGVAGRGDVQTGGEIVGDAWQSLNSELPETSPDEGGCSIAIDFSVGAGEYQTIHFYLGWYAPKWRAVQASTTNNDYSHMYATRFSNAQKVIEHLASNRDILLKRILNWQGVIYKEDRLPGWLQDSLVNILAVLPQNSFWINSLDPNHWWGSDGFFCVNESIVSCPQQSCIANDSFGEWVTSIFFPEQARNKLRAFKHYQRSSGQTPSTLGRGTEPDQPWYDQQLPVDGQAYIHMVERYWHATGNDEILDDYYESVKAGLNFMKWIDQDGDGLIDVKGSNQYYDGWPAMAGAAIHISGYWIATLRIVERMAEQMGDTEFAEDCRSWIKRGSESIEEKLWNEKTGSYFLYHQPATGTKSDTILSDQLYGQWLSHIHNLPRVFSESRTQQVLETIWIHNVKTARFGIRVAVRLDQEKDREGVYVDMQGPSYSSLTPAMLMIYGGDRDRGLEIMKTTWQTMVVDNDMAWDMPAFLTQEGEAGLGLEYYHLTMLWTLPMALLSEHLKIYRSDEGFAGRIINAANQSPKDNKI